ncbi:hypothetical protein [Chiayiivirga flava]|uniref:Uncharacterized protein n=1 Tax=Chiayiivirga flava TaxID=659595 RepID=A0A7W8D504_9GAMM|nr:hypothetical protein [Chiayiivirga flava]MBB5208034.1 hypothetical protein [Chiayiivirga flava]
MLDFAVSELMLEETRKLSRAHDLLWYRRLNWRVFVRDRIYGAFSHAREDASSCSYPFPVDVKLFPTPNEETIQITTGFIKTGAEGAAALEGGGALVASQSISGHVIFIVYPRKSDRVQSNFKEILLYRPIDPAELTLSKIQDALKKFFFVARMTSLCGHDSSGVIDRARLNWLLLNDLRYKNKLLRSVLSMRNKWGNIIITALLALLVALYVQK